MYLYLKAINLCFHFRRQLLFKRTFIHVTLTLLALFERKNKYVTVNQSDLIGNVITITVSCKHV